MSHKCNQHCQGFTGFDILILIPRCVWPLSKLLLKSAYEKDDVHGDWFSLERRPGAWQGGGSWARHSRSPHTPKLLLAAAYTSVETTRNEAAFYRSVLRSRHKDLTSGSTR